MSISNELSRISSNVLNALDAIERKGVIIPAGSNSDNLADLIDQITSGTGSAITITDEADSHGGTIRTITAVSLEGDTVSPSVLLRGYTAHNSLGEPIVGTYSGGGGTITLQTKTISPSESSQVITADTGYDALGEVDIDPISSTYVGSGITRRDSSDLTASGATVSVPSGYYASNASKAVASGTVTAPSSISGTSATVSTGTNTLTLSKTVSVTPSVTTAGYVSSGTAGNASVSLTASVTMQGAQTIYPSTSDQTINSGRYLTGNQTIKGVVISNLTADNIKSGVTVTIGDSSDADRVASVTGTYSGGGGGSEMNVQGYHGMDYVRATSYTATDVTLTVAKTGTYKVSWMGFRNTTSGTSGSQLYINGYAYGSATTSFTSSYGQSVVLNNVSLDAGDVLVVRARARATNYYMYVGNLIIEQTA